MHNTHGIGELQIRRVLELLLGQNDAGVLREFLTSLRRSYLSFIHPDKLGAAVTDNVQRINQVTTELLKLSDRDLLDAVRAYIATDLELGFFAQQEIDRREAAIQQERATLKRANKKVTDLSRNLELAGVAFRWLANSPGDAGHPLTAVRGYLFLTSGYEITCWASTRKTTELVKRVQANALMVSPSGRVLTACPAREYSQSRYVTRQRVKAVFLEHLQQEQLDVLRGESKTVWTDQGQFLGLAMADVIQVPMGSLSRFTRSLTVAELGGLIDRYLLKDVPLDLHEPYPTRATRAKAAEAVETVPRDVSVVAINPHDATSYDVLVWRTDKQGNPPIPPPR